MQTNEISKLFEMYYENEESGSAEATAALNVYISHMHDEDADEYAMAMVETYARDSFIAGFKSAMRLLNESFK